MQVSNHARGHTIESHQHKDHSVDWLHLKMNSLTINLRSFSRNIGLVRVINRFRTNRPYEDRFHKAIEDAIRPGDTAWDIGANVGFYTETFCSRVGPQGCVVAFEPFPESLEQIRERLPDCAWLRLENVALGDEDTLRHLVLSDNSTTHHLDSGTGQDPDARSIPVTVVRGDSVRQRLGGAPNLIKVDVEGFEEEVLSGLSETLSEPNLRAVFVEVHFHLLSQRGQANAPVRIEKMLRAKGFRVAWLDASHLQAIRP